MFPFQPDALHAPSPTVMKVTTALQGSERLFHEVVLLRGQSAHDHLGVLSTGSWSGSTSAFPMSSGDHKLILWKHGSEENPVNSGNTEKT